MSSVYHSGELRVQSLAGEEQGATANGRVISDKIVPGAINFIEKQPMVIVSSTTALGHVWVSPLIGIDFIKVTGASSMLVTPSQIVSTGDDVFFKNITENAEIGTLFIELSTRRRYRVNGTIHKADQGLELTIREAYPNCPQYIQRRTLSVIPTPRETKTRTVLSKDLTEAHVSWIEESDTLFVGTRSLDGRMDSSHRGGPPGFIEVLDSYTLKIPDYRGNSMFNSLGNLVENTHAGLLLINFKSGETLQLSGKGELLFNQTEDADLHKTTGTGRYWLFHLEESIWTEKHHHVKWSFVDYSPFNPVL